MIAPKLRLLLNTKKDLQAILKVPNGVPFNQYVRYLAWVGEPIPKAHLFGDYVKGRFTAGGKAVLQDEVGEFTRLSRATNFVGGELVEYEVGEARIEAGKGLLVEPQITNGMSSGDFKNNYPESLAQVTTGVDSGLGFNYTRFIGGGGGQRATVAFGMTGVSLFPVAFMEGRAISFLVKAEAPVRYMRFDIYATGMPLGHPFNTTIDLSDGSVVRQYVNFKVINVVPIGGGWLRVDFLSDYTGSPSVYRYLNVTFGMDGEVGTDPTTWTTLPEGVEVGLALPQHVSPPVYSSLTNRYGTPVTRAPDILRIPLLPNQSITIDADEGLRCVKDGASALISADTPAYLRTFAVDEAKVAFNNYATGVYKVDDMEVSFEQLNEFTRLTAATNFVGGELVEYAAGQPRIEAGKGLLVEPQRTNLYPNYLMTTGNGVIPTTLEVSEGNVVPAVRFPHGATTYSYVTLANPNPCVISAYVKNSDNLKPEFTGIGSGAAQSAGLDFAFVVGAGATINIATSTVSKHGDVYRVSTLSTTPVGAGTNGIVKYATNSAKDVTATYRQIEAGNTLTSLIKSSGAPATRSPDLLRLTIPAGKTLTLDADAGVTYIMENATTALITATEPGYIRSARIA